MIATTSSQTLTEKAKLFRGFSDPTRLAILEALRPGPLSVSAIVEATRLPQSTVSNHLACLNGCGLVATQQQGKYAYYSHSDERVELLLRLGGELMADVARGVYECTRM